MSYTLQQKSAPECWCHEVAEQLALLTSRYKYVPLWLRIRRIFSLWVIEVSALCFIPFDDGKAQLLCVEFVF